MSDKIIENNQVTIMGEVASKFTYSHEVFGEGFYMLDVLVRRLSNSEDRIPLMISERLIDVTKDYTGEFIMVSGQFRSYNRHEEQRNRLVLSVFVREVGFVDEELDEGDKSDFTGWVYLQATGVPEDTARTRNSRSASCSKSSIWKVRLHSLYLLGKKRTLCFRI